jgi:hypothetical protein
MPDLQIINTQRIKGAFDGHPGAVAYLSGPGMELCADNVLDDWLPQPK